jgi:hypothetical protein
MPPFGTQKPGGSRKRRREKSKQKRDTKFIEVYEDCAFPLRESQYLLSVEVVPRTRGRQDRACFLCAILLEQHAEKLEGRERNNHTAARHAYHKRPAQDISQNLYDLWAWRKHSSILWDSQARKIPTGARAESPTARAPTLVC